MKLGFFNIFIKLTLLIEACIAAKQITKLDSTSNSIMNTGEHFYGKNEENNAEFLLGLDSFALVFNVYLPNHEENKQLSPLSRYPDIPFLTGNIDFAELGDDAVFRVYNKDGKVIYTLGEECSVLGQSIMTFEPTDAYLNDAEYAVQNVPLTYGVVITNALGEKFYYPPRKSTTTDPEPEPEHEPEPVPSLDHMEWIEYNGKIPDGAVYINEPNDNNFVVGRIKYPYGYRSSYVNLEKKELIISNDNYHIGYSSFEILVGPSDHFYWKKMNKNTKLKDGHHIVVSGNDSKGNKLAVAKCKYGDKHYFGEVNLNKFNYATFAHFTHDYSSHEYKTFDYEVLIYSDKPVQEMKWIKWDGTIPADAVYIKNNPNGKTYIVGHTIYKNGVHCGFVDVDTKQLIISYGGMEIKRSDDFEILVGSSEFLEWKKINKDDKFKYNDKIVIGGNESNGVKLGVAKCKYEGNYYFGKVNLNYLNHANVAVDGKEVECYDIEVLINNEQEQDEAKPVSSLTTYDWIKWNGEIPEEAVYIKNNPNGKMFIVGRAEYDDVIYNGYVDITTTDIKLIYYYNGKVRKFTKNFEILVGPSDHFIWKIADRYYRLENYESFVTGGFDSKGTRLGVAKCFYRNNYYFGSINLVKMNYANFVYNNQEIQYEDCEVLIYSKKK